MKRLSAWTRRCTVALSAGVVFQAAGCQINTEELAAAFFTTVLNNLIANFVFGSFNLLP